MPSSPCPQQAGRESWPQQRSSGAKCLTVVLTSFAVRGRVSPRLKTPDSEWSSRTEPGRKGEHHGTADAEMRVQDLNRRVQRKHEAISEPMEKHIRQKKELGET